MAQFTEIRSPYEFLIRWNQDSTISGAHVGFLDTVLRDGEIVTQKQNNVESVAMGLQEGFPLSDILDQVLIDALLLIETVKKENQAIKTEIETAKAEVEKSKLETQTLQAENATAKAEIEKSKLEIEALKFEEVKAETETETLQAENATLKAEIEALKSEPVKVESK